MNLRVYPITSALTEVPPVDTENLTSVILETVWHRIWVTITYRYTYRLSIGSEIGDLEWPWTVMVHWSLLCVISLNSAEMAAKLLK